MARRDRRDFCKLAAATGALALTGTATLPGSALDATPGDAGQALLRELLARRRNRIRTLHLDVTTEYVHADPALAAEIEVPEGRSELYYRAGRYRVVRRRRDTSGELSVTEVSAKGWQEQRVEWIRRPPSGLAPRQPSLSLQKFLPVPRNRPLYDLGVRDLDGRQVRVVGQDDLLFYVDETVPLVLGVDVFVTSEEVGETIRYAKHRPTAHGVLFPRRIVARSLIGHREKVCLETLVHTVQVNG